MFTEAVYLERICRTRKMARYYRLSAVETLFGDWAVAPAKPCSLQQQLGRLINERLRFKVGRNRWRSLLLWRVFSLLFGLLSRSSL